MHVNLDIWKFHFFCCFWSSSAYQHWKCCFICSLFTERSRGCSLIVNRQWLMLFLLSSSGKAWVCWSLRMLQHMDEPLRLQWLLVFLDEYFSPLIPHHCRYNNYTNDSQNTTHPTRMVSQLLGGTSPFSLNNLWRHNCTPQPSLLLVSLWFPVCRLDLQWGSTAHLACPTGTRWMAVLIPVNYQAL